MCLLGPNGAGKTTTVEILEGFRISGRPRGPRPGRGPGTAPQSWRAWAGVVLQSWRDHPRWTPRRLLEHLGGYHRPYATPERLRPYDAQSLLDTVGLTAAEVRWSRSGERFVHATSDPNAFVGGLFAQHGHQIEDLEVKRASLEDAYLALAQQHEAGRVGVTARRFTEATR